MGHVNDSGFWVVSNMSGFNVNGWIEDIYIGSDYNVCIYYVFNSYLCIDFAGSNRLKTCGFTEYVQQKEDVLLF